MVNFQQTSKTRFGSQLPTPRGSSSADGFSLPEPKRLQVFSNGARGTCHEACYIDPQARVQGHMTFYRFNLGNPDTVGVKAAELLEELVLERIQENSKARPLVITPTGSTPKPFYKALLARTGMPWEKVRLRHLDEYIQKPKLGLKADTTYKAYMEQHLWNDPKLAQADKKAIADILKLKQPAGASIDSIRKDYEQAIQDYEQEIRQAGGADVIVLGIGPNGHIAFIEPPNEQEQIQLERMSPAQKRQAADAFRQQYGPAHRVQLREATLQANFGSPEERRRNGYTDEAVTLGLDAILSARHVILLATGENKREIVEKAFGDFSEPPTPAIPASYLKLHPNVTVITDF